RVERSPDDVCAHLVSRPKTRESAARDKYLLIKWIPVWLGGGHAVHGLVVSPEIVRRHDRDERNLLGEDCLRLLRRRRQRGLIFGRLPGIVCRIQLGDVDVREVTTARWLECRAGPEQ